MWENDRGTHLYMLARDDSLGKIKIGRSDNPDRRAAEMCSGHTFRVNVICTFNYLGHLETELHRTFRDLRVEGGSGREWFRVEVADVLAEVGAFLRAHGIAPMEALETKKLEVLAAEVKIIEAKAAAAVEKDRSRVDAFAAKARLAAEIQGLTDVLRPCAKALD